MGINNRTGAIIRNNISVGILVVQLARRPSGRNSSRNPAHPVCTRHTRALYTPTRHGVARRGAARRDAAYTEIYARNQKSRGFHGCRIFDRVALHRRLLPLCQISRDDCVLPGIVPHRRTTIMTGRRIFSHSEWSPSCICVAQRNDYNCDK